MRPPPMFSYAVTATFEDRAVADEWIAWLRDAHLAEVCAAGAIDAEAIRGDVEADARIRCEARYHFASRDAFEEYLREHAPRLRAEGLKRFPSERGVTYERATGEVAASHVRHQ